eukprot:6454919-Karenia_brevis.AAC.1
MQRIVVPNRRERRETSRPPPQVPTQRREINRPLRLKRDLERGICNCGEEKCIQAVEVESIGTRQEVPEKWIHIVEA